MHRTNRIGAAISTIVLLLAMPTHSLDAWLGPENVFVVASRTHPDSTRLAKAYCKLRSIPATNYYEMDWKSDRIAAMIPTCRDQILRPILREIETRGLARQIDCVTYSSGFPYLIDFRSEVSNSDKYAKGSLTSMTYLYRRVLAARGDYGQPVTNRYAATEPRAFHSRTLWQSGDDSSRYLLSTMLAYTDGRGNSADEAMRYLLRSAAADGIHYPGTVFFMRNGDVRSTTRDGKFAEVAAQTRYAGVEVQVAEGIIPQGEHNIAGLTMGAAKFDLNSAGLTILPGAIWDNLTSYGGMLKPNAPQTPLTDAMRYGAGGASGTVVEPYAIAHKFPDPNLHRHYAAGCSLAEAFYLSVLSPYQLLVVGDPLCNPWARALSVSLTPLPTDTQQPNHRHYRVSTPHRFDVARIYIDGLLIDEREYTDVVTIEVSSLRPGRHELRVVVQLRDAVESTGRAVTYFHTPSK